MYNSNTDSLGLILDVEVFFSLGHCSGALWPSLAFTEPYIQNLARDELSMYEQSFDKRRSISQDAALQA